MVSLDTLLFEGIRQCLFLGIRFMCFPFTFVKLGIGIHCSPRKLNIEDGGIKVVNAWDGFFEGVRVWAANN